MRQQEHCNVIIDIESGDFCTERPTHVVGEGVHAVLMCKHHVQRYVDVDSLKVRRRHIGT